MLAHALVWAAITTGCVLLGAAKMWADRAAEREREQAAEVTPLPARHEPDSGAAAA